MSLPASTGAVNLSWRQTKSGWWWLASKDKLTRLEGDPYGRAYELMRRHPAIGQEQFFQRHLDDRWPDLKKSGQASFVGHYWRWLANRRLGPTVQCINRHIIFDCTLPDKKIVADLVVALRCPQPLITGSDDSTMRPRGKGNRQNAFYTGAQTSQTGKWQPCRDPQRIELVLPKGNQIQERKTPVTADEARANLKTFLRHPPPNFVAHRKKLRINVEPRQRSLAPMTIVFGLMATDYLHHTGNTLKTLAEWLEKNNKAESVFAVKKGQIHRRLIDAKRSFTGMMRALK